jgi:hypothetical protein
MAIQKDYMLRMVEMIGDLIAAILGQIKKGDYQTASRSLENAYYEFLKEDASFFRSIPKDELTEKLLKEHNYTNGHLEILSGLFYTQAELSYSQGKALESLGYYEKSLLLLDFVIKASKTYSPEKDTRITALEDRIKDLKAK